MLHRLPHRSLASLIAVCAAAAFAAVACGKSESQGPIVSPPPPLPPPPPPTVTIGVSQTTIAYSDTVGTSSPPATTVAVTNAGTGTLTQLGLGAVTYTGGGNGWLTASLSGSDAPATLTLTADNAGLAAGTYTATVPVASAVASNSPQNVVVTLMLATAPLPPPPPPPPPITGITIIAVGNLGDCNGGSSRAAADVAAAANPDYVFLMGDNVRPQAGTVAMLQDYQNCFEPAWGRFKNIIYASLGEQEVDGDTLSPTAAFADGADAYFGAPRVGPPGKNYHSFNIGSWHVVSLNIQSGGPKRPVPIRYNAGSAQLNWLWSDLGANLSTKCTLAFWHDPMWQSSNDPPTPSDPAPNHYYRNQPVRGIWTVLYERGADLVLNAGQHIYERFAPMRYAEGYSNPTPSEFALDSARGIRQITAGLGGDGPHTTPSFAGTHPLSEYRSGGNGVLKVVLGNGEYSWEFLNTSGSNVQDSGRGTCH